MQVSRWSDPVEPDPGRPHPELPFTPFQQFLARLTRWLREHNERAEARRRRS